mmetsp:Transcript_39440/g.63184  ORF Transcript_39440/g.63184 Transcript_39440/m.63184 type:complete len:126 (+) Transcript_39440:1-378(+)
MLRLFFLSALITHAEKAREIYSFKYVGHQCEKQTATVEIEQLGYGALWRRADCSECTFKLHASQSKQPVIRKDLAVVGWTHKIELKPIAKSLKGMDFHIMIGAWGEEDFPHLVNESFHCAQNDEM